MHSCIFNSTSISVEKTCFFFFIFCTYIHMCDFIKIENHPFFFFALPFRVRDEERSKKKINFYELKEIFTYSSFRIFDKCFIRLPLAYFFWFFFFLLFILPSFISRAPVLSVSLDIRNGRRICQREWRWQHDRKLTKLVYQAKYNIGTAISEFNLSLH